MNLRSLAQAGHWPTLLMAFLYFDMSFMVWVLLGPLAVHIAADLGLTPAQKGMMVAIPVLSGALLRILLGAMVDHIGPRRTGLIGQAVVIAALVWAWLAGLHSLTAVHALGVLLGVAGASFAVALPLASRWYPPESQGLALGIAGAGNSGTVLAALFAPTLANLFGWNSVFGLALIPLGITLVVFFLFARDAPDRPAPQRLTQYFTVLRDADTWWFMFFYSVTFGGFVGLASSLVIYFNDQYRLSPVIAGLFTAACVFAGSMFRPIGGALADRHGGVRSLSFLYIIAAASLALVSFAPASRWLALGLFFVAMMALGMGNGAVFQLVPQRFRREIGVMTGLVGMAGGIGGFYLAASLGWSKQWTGNYQTGLLMFASLAIIALIGLTGVKRRWRTTWGASSVSAARI
ncbi:MAG TPA: nitrate/nitrite transporter [Acidiferrobacterales bacterium]